MKTKALIPLFLVSDVDAAVLYYTRVQGFSESFRYGTYAGLQLGSCEIHLTDPGEPRHVVGAGTAYVICDEVEGYFGSIKAAGAKLKSEPADRMYGMRDFAVFDPDGISSPLGAISNRPDRASAVRKQARVDAPDQRIFGRPAAG